MNVIRLTVKNGPGVNAHTEGEAIAAFLFERCNANVSEAAVLAYLRRTKAEAAAHPATGAAFIAAPIKRLLDALE